MRRPISEVLIFSLLLNQTGCILSKATVKNHAPKSQERIIDLTAQTENKQEISKPEIELTSATADTQASRIQINSDENFTPSSALNQQVVTLNLGTALSLIGGQHPAVGFARWKLEEAYAQLDQAEILWLPTIRTGISYHNHDGNLQASNGAIQDVHRNSLQYGFGTGAVGAGTTMNPGLQANFELADAIFEPRIKEKTAWARGHQVSATLNSQLLNVALSYNSQLSAEQRLSILESSHQKYYELAKLSRDFFDTGHMHQADAERVITDLHLLDIRILQTREELDVNSARLCEVLSLRNAPKIEIQEPVILPVQLVDLSTDNHSLISTGLHSRPELKEAQCLVSAACESYQRQKMAPFIPSVLLGYSQTGFGGGLGNNTGSIDHRSDFDAMAVWEVRNLGLGEQSARAQEASRYQQSRFEQIRIMDRVTREIEEAYAQAVHRRQRIQIAKDAVTTAQKSYDLNLIRIRQGQDTPHDAVRSLQLLENAQLTYVTAVTDYNAAQYKLQWALGWPVWEGHQQPASEEVQE